VKSNKYCPSCDSLMDLVDTARGKVYSCECGKVIRIQPKKVEVEEPEARPEDSMYVEDTPEVKRQRKELRRRRVARRRERSNPFLENLQYYTGALGAGGFVILGLLAFWLFSLMLICILPPLAYPVAVIGVLAYLGGYIWLAVIALQDEPSHGIIIFLGLLVGIAQLYAIVYTIMHIGETWKAAAISVLGLLITLSAIVVMVGALGLRH
jgi:hypothetical protein